MNVSDHRSKVKYTLLLSSGSLTSLMDGTHVWHTDSFLTVVDNEDFKSMI